MGAGIAQVAAAARWDVVLSDVSTDVAARALDRIDKRFSRLVEKGRMSKEDAGAATARIRVADGDDSFGECALVIEAVVEDLEAKIASLSRVARAAPADAVLASNTSSLSVTRIGEGVGAAERTIGMHFFNPVPLMPLVEV
ncbi:MAG: 3-hydroxybutyryl-CoA dehydrogenase, partial [Planctomycetota bacterium]